jgi:hypothetical protein
VTGSPPPRAPACAGPGLALVAVLALCGCSRTTPGNRAAGFDPDTIPDAYRSPSAALMWPGATRAFQVTPRGDLTNGAWTVRIRPSEGGLEADPPRVIASEDRWLPVVRWRRRGEGISWEFEAVSSPGPAPRDSGLLASLEARARNTTEASREARLSVRLETPAPDISFAPFDAADPEPGTLRWAGGGAGAANGWSAAGGRGDSSVTAWRIAPGETRTIRLVLPAYPEAAASLRAWARVPHEQRVNEARRFWTDELARGTGFDLRDAEVERALRAATVVLLSCRERRGSRWVPIGGPFQYRDVWLRDGARAIRALAVCGQTRAARELAEGFLEFEWPQGAFVSQRGQLDGTGQALWAFEQAWLRPAPDDSVARFAAAALRAVRWCEWQRGLGSRAGWPFGVMLPFGEPRDAELTRAQLTGNDAWALAGYRATERLLRAAGRDSEAAEVGAATGRYRADFARALERSGHADLPPSWQRVGRDWGNLSVAYPCGALPPGHPRCAALARRIWAASGGAGLTWYGHRDSLHYYLGADLGTWALLVGRRAQADSVLDALLLWRDACGGAGEIFTRGAHDFGRNLPPHATAAAVLIDLARNALLFDDGDTLQLTLGARERWWSGGRVTRAPTRWGLVDLEFARNGSEASWRWTPVLAWTALTLPPGSRLARDPAPPLVAARGGVTVLAPPGTSSVRVALASIPDPR